MNLLSPVLRPRTFVLALAIAVGIRYRLLSQPCDDAGDPTVEIKITGNGEFLVATEPCQVFSGSYEEARIRFRQGVTSLGLSYEALDVVPGQDYTMDIVVVPGDAPGLVVHTSGVHGVEGYAGSAIQLAFLHYLQKRKQEDSGPLLGMPTVVLVHAFNPYGMAHYRRPNENNVDLNRNALTDDELQTLASEHSNHENYRKFEGFFNPTGIEPTFLYAYFWLWTRAATYLATEGYYTLKAALVGGQYYRKRGIFYGGEKTKEPSVRLFEDWLRTFIQDNSSTTTAEASEIDTTEPVQHAVTWIDVHTGLGPSGVDTLLVSPERDGATELERWFPGGRSAPSTGNDKKSEVTRGYETSKGFTINYYDRQFLDSSNDSYRDPLLMVQEIGTVPGTLVAHALILENMAYFSSRLSDEEKLAWAQRTTGRVFYPQTPSWRQAVLNRGIAVLFQAITRSTELSHHKSNRTEKNTS